MKNLSKLDWFALLLHVSAFLTIVVGAHISGYEDLLKEMSKESGLFEWISVLLLLYITIFGSVFGVTNRKKVSIYLLIPLIGFAFISFIGAMEELSWGQHIFHFESSDLFKESNLQQETNLHNFMKPELFSSIIYSSVYTIFVFVPLIIKMLASKIRFFALFTSWLPSLHVTLIILFGSSFQAYFFDDFGAWFDMGTQIAGMLLFALYIALYYKEIDNNVIYHYIGVWMTIGAFMLSYKVFGFYNMQYEIREMFVVLAVLYFYTDVLKKIESRIK